ncbi:acyltransferase family protein [Moheibacter stercoris]|uniref:Peptidoglycan/LPS O-acetylase OafA/YrhL n=1 Tax=Moheibacter stercoris TaxID=1628251 RepID=A0ABV2LPP3_9FLAO
MGRTSVMTGNKIYLPGLNGIRAIAAMAVVVSHTNNRLPHFGLSSLPNWDLAGYGVTMFFALSGFLITYLLLKEFETFGTIQIKKFYLRRIFRIWPLYYFYLLVILAIVGYSALGKTFFMYLLILPNIANGFANYNALPWGLPTATAMSLIGHYWSLGVEEQFYSFWPWIIKKLKWLFEFLLIFPVLFLGIKIIAKYLEFPEPIQFILHYSRFGCLAIGALGAYVFWKKYKIVDYINHPIFQTLIWAFLLMVAFNKFHIFSIIDHEIIAIFIVFLIINQISSPKPIFSLENKIFDYLGKISFGIYVYNPLVIFLLYSVAHYITRLPNNFVSYFGIFFIVILLNILIAHISYHTLEKYFLKIKHKYSTVRSSASKEEYNEKA